MSELFCFFTMGYSIFTIVELIKTNRENEKLEKRVIQDLDECIKLFQYHRAHVESILNDISILKEEVSKLKNETPEKKINGEKYLG